MKLEPIYAITDARGDVEETVEGSLDQTVEKALSVYGRHTPIYFNGDLEQLQKEGAHRKTVQEIRRDNPSFVDASMSALGPNFFSGGRPRVISLDEVWRAYSDDAEGLRKAFEALRPFFPRRGDVVIRSAARGIFGLAGGTYETAAGMKKAFLVANAKTKKAEEGLGIGETGGGATVIEDESIPPSLSKGLAFLPHALAKNAVDFPQFKGLSELRARVGVCVGSSEECRKSCLVYAGQNQAVAHNNVVKGMRLQAFLEEPIAFMRMLIESTRFHIETSRKAGVIPYFRPNILSDICYEVLFPEFFSLFRSLRIYDYTKIPGRDVAFLGQHHGVDRYDLTFSFSGTNARFLEEELARGRRLAIVFLRGLKAGSKGRKGYRAPESFADLRFMGQKVIDGDTHDLRPLDPQGTVVGLRFKALRGALSGSRPEQISKAGRFVVTAPKHDSKYVVEVFRDEHGNLITAGTPQQQGISEETLYNAAE